VLDEFGLCHGDVRVDVAHVGELLHGYELKSEKDTLARLPKQVCRYGEVLDRCTLVVTERHLAKAAPLVPEWWGLTVAAMQDGAVRLSQARPTHPNPGQQPLCVVRLLWREEALALLEEAGAARGVRGKAKAILYRRLVDTLPAAELLARVRQALRARTGWRGAA